MKTMDQAKQQLANSCLEYLRQEDAYLDALRQSLKAIRAALLSREMTALDERLQGIIAARPAGLRELQLALRVQLAPLLSKKPEDIRLEDVGAFVDKQVRDNMIESMRRKRHEIELLNASNLAITAALSRMVDRFLHQTTGVPTTSTYGPTGEMERTGHGRVENQVEF